jgi:hypothetical protein
VFAAGEAIAPSAPAAAWRASESVAVLLSAAIRTASP